MINAITANAASMPPTIAPTGADLEDEELAVAVTAEEDPVGDVTAEGSSDTTER